MKRILSIIGIGVAVLAWIAVPAHSRVGADPASKQSFFVGDSAGSFRNVDVGDTGLSPGDTIYERSPVFDVSSGNQVGVSVTRVTVVQVRLEGDDTVSILDSTLVIPGGRMTYTGAFHTGIWQGVGGLGWRGLFSITGGSGGNVGAAGVVSSEAGQFQGMDGSFLTVALS